MYIYIEKYDFFEVCLHLKSNFKNKCPNKTIFKSASCLVKNLV